MVGRNFFEYTVVNRVNWPEFFFYLASLHVVTYGSPMTRIKIFRIMYCMDRW